MPLSNEQKQVYHGRLWMQDDKLHLPGRSGDATVEMMRARASLGNLRIVEPGTGNLVSSMVAPGQHLPILDLDRRHTYVPSSTPGHGHLYLNTKRMSDSEYFTFISAMVTFGVVDKGSLNQLKAYSMSMVRPPHVKKPTDDTNWDEYTKFHEDMDRILYGNREAEQDLGW